MKLDYSALKQVTEKVNEAIKDDYINNVTVINSRDFLITFSKLKTKQLLISINHQNPFLGLINKQDSKPTIVGSLNDSLRKYLKGAKINDVTISSNDRVVYFSFSKANDYFQIESKKMILELIPHRPNMLIVDDQGIIEFALHYTSITSPHIILKGFAYSQLANNFVIENSDFSFEDFDKFVENYLFESNQDRKKEKYQKTIKFVQSKIKSIKHKLVTIEREIKTAESRLSYKEIGQNLLSYSYTPELVKDYVNESGISFDETLSIVDNAEKYFKQYKKAKRTLEIDSVEKSKALDSLNKFETILVQIPYMNELDLLDLSKELLPENSSKAKQTSKVNLTYIEVNNTKIYFGKNAHQNEEITFKIADQNDHYLHIKDLHGAHVIIKSSNPDNDTLLTAAEICLILSGQEAGEVMHAVKKNVKKGSSLGEAFVKEYSLIRLNNVREDTYKKIKITS